ncbi:MAG TPA: MATE family efflux transporter [Allocoleopsis sp.]
MYAFTKSRVFREIKACLFLAVPLAGAQLAQSAIAFVDTVMMGWLGSDTIAAGGLGATVFNTLLITATSIVSAVSPLAAEAFGAGNLKHVERVVRQGLWLALGLAIPITALLLHAAGLLEKLGQAPDTIALTTTYLNAIAWGIFPALGFAVLRYFVSALSLTRPIIIVMLLGTMLNIAGNYVLMLGKFGLPALGLAGIGWASTISLWSMFLALAIYIVVQPQLRHYRVLQTIHHFDLRVFQNLLRVGAPIGILTGTEISLFAVTALLMGQLGNTTLAAHQIALQSAALTFNVPLGISIATTVRVGQQLGKGDRPGSQLAGYVGIGLGATFMAMTGLLFWLMPESIVSLYLNIHEPANATVVNLAKSLLGIAAVFQIADGIQVTANGALRGRQDTYIPILIGLFAYWGIVLTSGYMLGMQFGYGGVGLWWGLAIGLTAAAIVLTWRFIVQPTSRAMGEAAQH